MTDAAQPIEGELLTAPEVWVGHLVLEVVRTVALVVIAVAVAVMA